MNTVRDEVAAVFRAERARIVATLIRQTGDWGLAEECVQDAFAQALEAWPRDGVPRSPGGWLTTAARRRAVDRLRRSSVEAAKLREAADVAVPEPEDDGGIADDLLRLVFTCCHPALPLESRVALTLRTVAGLTTAEIARAFLVSEAGMAKRLVRARQKIKNAGIPYRVPPAHLLPERTGSVLGVLYLLFNEGYSAAPERRVLCVEAIRLARTLAGLMPDEPEALGLLALMLLHDSRREARVADGDLVPLADQDRALWDTAKIDEGTALLDGALRRGRPGPYQVQAAIAACHTAEETDWPQIVLLYGQLAKFVPSPTVELNRAVAVSMADGPAAGLVLVDGVAGALAGHHLVPATRADLLRRLGRDAEAAAAYREAVALAPTEEERRYLSRRLADLPGSTT